MEGLNKHDRQIHEVLHRRAIVGTFLLAHGLLYVATTHSWITDNGKKEKCKLTAVEIQELLDTWKLGPRSDENLSWSLWNQVQSYLATIPGATHDIDSGKFSAMQILEQQGTAEPKEPKELMSAIHRPRTWEFACSITTTPDSSSPQSLKNLHEDIQSLYESLDSKEPIERSLVKLSNRRDLLLEPAPSPN